jgi:hypothetical protein
VQWVSQKTKNYEGIYDVYNVCTDTSTVEDSHFMHLQSRTEKRKSLLRSRRTTGTSQKTKKYLSLCAVTDRKLAQCFIM